MAYYDTMEPCALFFNVLVISDLEHNTAILGDNYVLCTARFTEAGWQGHTTTVAVTAGALPTGTAAVYVSSTHTVALVGTPTAIGLFSFTLTVTNNGNSVAISFSNIKVTATPQQSVAALTTFVGVVGQAAYLPKLKYFGASPSVTWTGANLPAGLTVFNIAGTLPGDGSTGAIAGTPTAAGVYEFQLTASGSLGDTTTVNAMLLIVTFQNPAMMLPAMYLNVPYSFSYDQDAADTGRVWSSLAPVPPYTWSLAPPLAGFTMTSAGMLSGTPAPASVNTNSRAYSLIPAFAQGTPSGSSGGSGLVYVLPGSPPAFPAVFGSFVGFATAGHFAGGTK